LAGRVVTQTRPVTDRSERTSGLRHNPLEELIAAPERALPAEMWSETLPYGGVLPRSPSE
jgi:hypothetical protein